MICNCELLPTNNASEDLDLLFLHCPLLTYGTELKRNWARAGMFS